MIQIYISVALLSNRQVYEQPQWVEVPAVLLPQSRPAKRLERSFL